jgi:hypothetical protein
VTAFDHVHLLEIVDVSFCGHDVLISINSILHAMTASNCLISQSRDKRCKIDVSPDECTRPFPRTPVRNTQRQAQNLFLLKWQQLAATSSVGSFRKKMKPRTKLESEMPAIIDEDKLLS